MILLLNYGCLVNSTLDDCFQQHIAWSFVESNVSCAVDFGLYMASKHHFSFATNLAVNFDCKLAIKSELCQGLFPSFAHRRHSYPDSRVAVLIDWNMSRPRCSFLGPAVNKDLLLHIFDSGHTDLFLCHILLWGQWMIGRLSKAMSAVLVCQGPSSLRASLSPRQNSKLVDLEDLS